MFRSIIQIAAVGAVLAVFSAGSLLGQEEQLLDPKDLDPADIPAELLNVVSIDLRKTPFGEVLSEISKKSDVKLNYNASQLPVDQSVNVKMENVTVLEVLLHVLEKTGARLVITRGGQIAIVASSEPSKGSISGFVHDASNGESLIGCNVFLSENSKGSSSNLSGYYVIPKVEPGVYTLVVSYIGYHAVKREVEILPGEQKVVNVRMEPQALEGQLVEIFADSVSVMTRLFEKPISKLSLTPGEINLLPQVAESDLLRTLQTLPGIVPVSDYSSAPYVRGGTPDQNLYLIDGTDVYNPEHAFGLFSMFNTDAIKQVEVYKGGFGSEYGGRLSSILNVTHLDGNRERFEGTASVSVLSAKSTLQFPLGDFGSLSGSFRRTYFDQTVARFINNIPEYYFYDGNVKAFIDINGNNNLTISGYGGRDFLDIIQNENAADDVSIAYDWGNKTGSARWTTVFNPKLFANFWVTGSRFTSDFDLSQTLGMSETNDVVDITFKGDLEYSYSQELGGKFGFEQKNLHVTYRQVFPDSRADIDRSPRHYAAYGTIQWRPNPLWHVQPGLRFNYFDSDRNFVDLGPRISLKYRAAETVNLKATTGVYHQYLNRIPRAFIADIWTVADKFQKASTAYHYIIGYQQEIAGRYELEIETYYKEYRNIHAFNEAFLASVTTDRYDDGIPVFTETQGIFHEGDGTSWGAELLLRRRHGILSGWIGYAFSKTEYEFTSVNTGKPFPPRHDKPSTLNIVGNVDLNNLVRLFGGRAQKKDDRNRWRFGFVFVYASGQPITRPGSGYLANSLPDFNAARNYFTGDVRDFVLYPEAINSFRLPAYIRMDVSLRYEHQFKNWSLETFAQVFNVGNRRNVWFVQYQDDSDGGFDVLQDIKTTPMFPILPTIGFQAKF